MGEKILARVKRERFFIARINNQRGLDTPAKQAFMGGSVSKQIVAGTKETAHTIKELPGRGGVRAPSIPDCIVMDVAAP